MSSEKVNKYREYSVNLTSRPSLHFKAMLSSTSQRIDKKKTLLEALKKFKHKFLLYTLNNSIIETICKKKKINFCSEYFFDRRYVSKRQLINRSKKNALLIDPDEAICQFNNLIDFEELKKNNKRLTVCIHMDGKNSINMAKKLREFIDSLDP